MEMLTQWLRQVDRLRCSRRRWRELFRPEQAWAAVHVNQVRKLDALHTDYLNRTVPNPHLGMTAIEYSTLKAKVEYSYLLTK